MKSKDLISQILDADPTGECECVVGGCDIFSVDREPGYYDGPYQVLVRDHTKDCYNVVGGKITSLGTKVDISIMPLKDAMFEALFHGKEFPVEIETSDAMRQRYEDMVEKWRKKILKQKADFEMRRQTKK